MTTLLPADPVAADARPGTAETELPLEEISQVSTGQPLYYDVVKVGSAKPVFPAPCVRYCGVVAEPAVMVYPAPQTTLTVISSESWLIPF